MKKFLGYIVLLIFIIGLTAFSLDKIYSKSFNSSTNLNRFKLLKFNKNKKFNLVFVGSSRVVNTIIPEVFNAELNITSFNFGIMNSQPKDILTIVKLLKAYNISYDALYVQVDYYYNSLYRSNFLRTEMLPFIGENNIIDDYYKLDENFKSLKYIPFYKYASNDSKLGLRNAITSVFKNNNKLEKTNGFEPLYGYGHAWQRKLPDSIISNNKYIKELESFKKINNLNVRYFVAPFRKDTQGMHYINLLKNKIPGLIDFSTSIKDEKHFKNGYHLNNEGAKLFSKQFSNYLKNNKNAF